MSFLISPETPSDNYSLKDNYHNETQSAKVFSRIQSEQNTESNTVTTRPVTRNPGACPDGSCSK
ncbi:hypothetical protein ABN763_18160 [Spongiivirga sp. MCCC 1A20706]|uniref:hypothetical protein n=1 Tax=Spongiivirga sp. MCCC 1A20706 TaxID=3160963 RepID=UPI00397746F6